MIRLWLSLVLGVCLGSSVYAQSVHRLGGKPEGEAEGMLVQALGTSPVQYGCAGSVAVDIPNILFENDKARLTPAAAGQMDVLARALGHSEFRHDTFVIEGHASAPGSDAHNMDLSERRAEVVQSAMTRRGIAKARIAWRAYGERRLLYPKRPDHADNRRVTIRRIAVGSAQWEALEIAARERHRLSHRLMVAEDGGAWWALPRDVVDRRLPVFLCASASRGGLLHVEIREAGQKRFEPVATYPLPEGGLVRVPHDRNFKFTGRAPWQEIRLRHVDCTRAACPRLSAGLQERLEIAPKRRPPKPVNLPSTGMARCGAPGVVCEVFKVRHE
ncbi:OmpA family protein [Pacificoceanicola onchidii]|uniref:OmpA family protein n=1 Tax=Pacificoceanicola onchidii TaxID=2562685 RepID=UPI0010A61ED0|nr:OmpA family protein [Pacificoceanicola onchidii]